MKQRWHSSWFFLNNAIRVYSLVDNFPVMTFYWYFICKIFFISTKMSIEPMSKDHKVSTDARTCSLIRLVHCVLFSFEKSHNRDIFLQHGVLHITELFLEGGRVSHLLLHEIHDICGEHSIYWKHSQPRHRAIETVILRILWEMFTFYHFTN